MRQITTRTVPASQPANQNEADQASVLVKNPIKTSQQPVQKTQPLEQHTHYSQPTTQQNTQPMQTRKPIALRHQLPMAEIHSDPLIDIEDISKSVRVAPPPVLERTSTQYAQVAYAPGNDAHWAQATAAYKDGLQQACNSFSVPPPTDGWTAWVSSVTSVALALRHTQLIYRFPPASVSSSPSSLTEGICSDMQTTWLALISDIRTTFTRMGLGEDVPSVLPRLHDIAATSVVLREIVTASSTIHSTYPMWIGSEDSPIPIGTLAQAILRASIRMNAYYEMAVEANLKNTTLVVHDHDTIASTYMEFSMWEEWRKSASYLDI